MLSDQGGASFLIYELDGVTSDRVRQILRSDGGATCVVDSIPMFHELRARLPFDGFIVGIQRAEDLEELKLSAEIEPLALLVPHGRGVRHFSVALPGARLVDRRLGDPDALRGWIGGAPAQALSDEGDVVRQAFAPFGLSERQLEVLRRALLGESGGQIAAGLFISELTVRNHLHAIYERIGVSGRRELMGRFVRGLIEADDSP